MELSIETRRTLANWWFEARSIRGGLLFLAAGVVLVGVFGAALSRGQQFRTEEAHVLVLAFAWLAALFVLGTEVVPRCRSEKTLGFSLRMPGGARGLMYSKLALYFGGLCLAPVSASLAYDVAAGTPPGSWGDSLVTTLRDVSELRIAWLPALALSAWVFAAGTWVPTGILALPAGMLVTGAATALLWTFALLSGRPGPAPTAVMALLIWLAGCGLGCAYKGLENALDGGSERSR